MNRKINSIIPFMLALLFTVSLGAQDNNADIRPYRTAYAGDEILYSFLSPSSNQGTANLLASAEGLPPQFSENSTFEVETGKTVLLIGIPEDAVPGRVYFDIKIGEQRFPRSLSILEKNNLILEASTLTVSALRGKTVDIPFSVGNGGRIELNNTVISVNLPGNWKYSLSRWESRVLKPGESINARLTLTIPAKESPGIKKVELSAVSDDTAEAAKIINVEVKQPLGIIWILLAVILTGLSVLVLINRKYGRR